MRTIAIGDIHGCRRALDILLEEVRPAADDVVITLGDYVDRGPDTCGVIERLLRLQGECRLHPLKGNHEVMMLEARTDSMMEKEWRRHGGDRALQSYASTRRHPTLADVPAAHWAFLEACGDSHETETHLFAHANVDPGLPMHLQPASCLFWSFLDGDAEPHFSGKTLVVGHTSQKSGLPRHLGHTVCIDTFAWGGGWLSALIIEARLIVQASEDGRVRELELDDLAPGAV